MGSVTSIDDLIKKRNSAYKNQVGPFTDLDAVYTQDVVPSEGAFLPRLSVSGLTRPAFDDAAKAILDTKFRSPEVSDAGATSSDTNEDSQA
jgi:hypothetical protein